MILDSRLEFGDATSVVQAVGTLVFPNQVDTGAVVRDLGNGEPLYLVLTVDTNIVGTTGAGSITFQLVTDSAANMTTAPVVLAQTAALVTNTTVTAGQTAGSNLWTVALPQGTPYKQFLGVKMVVAGNNVSAGKVNAFLTKDLTGNAIYPDALGAGQ